MNEKEIFYEIDKAKKIVFRIIKNNKDIQNMHHGIFFATILDLSVFKAKQMNLQKEEYFKIAESFWNFYEKTSNFDKNDLSHN